MQIVSMCQINNLKIKFIKFQLISIFTHFSRISKLFTIKLFQLFNEKKNIILSYKIDIVSFSFLFCDLVVF